MVPIDALIVNPGWIGMPLGRARKRFERCRGLIAIWVACSGYGGSNGVLMAFPACFQLWVKTPVTKKEREE
jgi:hypothetical protein